jgi:hypothetical protein
MAEGFFPLFGFAVADYIATYGTTYEDAENCVVFGAVLTGRFARNDQLLLEFVTNPVNEELKLLVFEVSDLTAEEIKDWVRNINGLNGFTELEDVYENRIVFARK